MSRFPRSSFPALSLLARMTLLMQYSRALLTMTGPIKRLRGKLDAHRRDKSGPSAQLAQLCNVLSWFSIPTSALLPGSRHSSLPVLVHLRKSRRALLGLLAALLLTSGITPRAFAALLEDHTPVTYNMQGAATGNQSKWITDVLPLSNSHDIVALQEAGSAPPGAVVSAYPTNEGRVTETLWSVGTNASPSYRYVYFLETDPNGHRVNLAIVTRTGANAVTTIPPGIATVSRGALGVRIGLMWFFTLHGLSGNGNDDAQLLRNIESANLFGLFWAALGDFNRDPGALIIPSDATIYHPGRSTQQSGGELDYMVSNDVVECPPQDLEVTAHVMGGLSSDHYPVDFPVRQCPDPGETKVAPLTLMSVGADIVVGSSQSNVWLNSYRGDLQNDLSADGLSWNFVGSQKNGNLSDPYYEAYNGNHIDQLETIATPNIKCLLPNLITVLAGDVDIADHYQLDTAPLRLSTMIEDFFNADPGVTIIVGTVLPPFHSSDVPFVEAFNNKLPGLVENEQQHGRHILLADMGSVQASDMYYPYANAAGYQAIADTLNNVILQAITIGWLAHPIPCSSGNCGPSGGDGSGGGGSGSGGVCDIYASGGTPCVAAHSTVRALFSGYSGRLYQVKRAADSTSSDISTMSTGGYADASKQDSFCAGTTCIITTIYDQTSLHNDLPVEQGIGAGQTADSGAVADALPISVNGHAVYGVKVTSRVGYRNNTTSGTARGASPESMYMVTSGTYVNSGCCFDYGNVEASVGDTGNGHMDALNFGTACIFGPCSGSGPWVEADLENGQYMGNGSNLGNPTIGTDFVTAMLKNNGKTTFALKSGDAQSGGLTTGYSGTLPTISPGYIPMSLEGSIVLGTGGDNSNWGVGAFFEGAMTSGYPSDATENAVQANIVAAGYTGNSGGKPGSGGSGNSGDHPDNGGASYTGPSDPGGPGPQDGFNPTSYEKADVLMGSKPALAAFNGSLYLAFQANDTGHTLHVTSSTNGNFGAAAQIPDVQIGSAPAMAVFNKQMFLSFRANDAGHTLHVTSSSDGQSWPAAVQEPNIQIGSAPAMAVFKNQLYLAFQANDTGHTLHVTASPDGQSWPSAWQVPNIAIGSAPALATVNGKLYVAWRADDSSNDAWIASSSDGVHFSSQVLTGQTMGQSSSPALAVANNTLFYIYGANDAANEMLVMTSTDGTTWQGPAVYLNTQMGPAGPGATWYATPISLSKSLQIIAVGFQSNDSRNVLFATSKLCTSSGGCP